MLPVAALLYACSDEAPELQKRQEPPATALEDGAVTGTAPRASGGFPSVVILKSRAAGPMPVPADAVVMDQYGIDFHPRMLLVRAGQRVEFRNSEDVLHNVHVIDTETRETLFNVATPVTGSYDYTFEREGAYDVSCNVHPSMAAFIIVTATPYAVVAERDGAFRLPDVPPGTYDAIVWNIDKSRRLETVVDVHASATELVLAPQ